MKKIISVLLMITLLCAFCACNTKESDSGELKKITVALDYTPNTNHTGLYAAKELGYFADAGFDVEIIQPSEDGAEIMVASNQAQFGVSFQENVVIARTNDDPLPIKAVAAIVEHNTSGIMSIKEKNITSPKDMEGKRYATWDLPVEKATLESVITKDGGDFSKVTMINSTVTDAVSALQTDIDCLWVFYGWDAMAAIVKNVDINYFAFSDIDPVLDFYTPVLISNETYLKNNSSDAKAFLEAVKKGYIYAIEHHKEAADILLKHVPEIDRDLCYASMEYLSTQYASDKTKWGIIDKDRWDGFANWLFDQKIITKKAEDGFVSLL